MPAAFLLTPFSATAAGDEKPATYRAVQRAVRDACKDAGVELRRADSIFRSGVVIDQIREAIADADLVIAVCTGKNANVFYELGLAEAVGHRAHPGRARRAPPAVRQGTLPLPHVRGQAPDHEEPARTPRQGDTETLADGGSGDATTTGEGTRRHLRGASWVKPRMLLLPCLTAA